MKDKEHYLNELQLHAYKADVKAVKNLLKNTKFSPFAANKNEEIVLQSTLILFLSQLNNPEIKNQKTAIFRIFLQKLKDLYQENSIKALAIFRHKDAAGNNFLHYMATYGFDELFEELLHDDDWIRQALIGNDGLIFQCNNFSRYPIHVAVLNNQEKIVKLFLDIPGVATLKDSRGQIALHYSAKFANQNIVQLCCNVFGNLADKDNYINLLDADEKTPLMLANEMENIKAQEVLIERGAKNNLNGFQRF